MTIKDKEFDCIKFKDMLQANLRKKTAGMTSKQYIDYINAEARKSPLHKGFFNSPN
jgi:hypothetical protein